MHVKSSQDELQDILHRRTPAYVAAMDQLAKAVIRRDAKAHASALANVAELVGETMIFSNLIGRRRFMLQVDSMSRRHPKRLAHAENPGVPRVEAVEAIESLIDREPRLARSAAEVSHVYRTRHAFAAARSADVAVTKRVQDAIASSMREGKPVPEAAELIREVTGGETEPSWTQAYAETVYRTNAATAYTQGRFDQAADPDFREVAPAFRYTVVGDVDTRANHKAADGLIADTRDPIWQTFAPPLGYNCFPAGTITEGNVLGAQRAWYSGPIIQLTFESGRVLSVTPHHPISTPRGFVAANLLHQGDQALCQRVSLNGRGPAKPDKHNAPSKIEQVFGALSERWHIFRAGVVADDFNGDAALMKPDIDIVWADSQLANWIPPQGAHQIEYGGLIWSTQPAQVRGYRESGFDARLHQHLATATCRPSGAALANTAGLAHGRPLQTLRVGPASDWYPTRYQSLMKGAAADTECIRQLLEGLPAEVTLDQIINVDIYPFSGHVYDLQTSTGYMVANGIITSNCRCDLEVVDQWELRSRGLIDGNGRVITYRPPSFASAHPDPGFGGHA